MLRPGRILTVFFVSLCAIVFWHESALIPLRLGLFGFGPDHYVWLKSQIWPALQDFPTSVAAYDLSLAMRTYLWADTYLSIPANYFAYIYVLVEAGLFIFSAYHLGEALTKKRSTALFFCAVVLVSHLVGANLGSFGLGLQSSIHPLYYGFANAFCMLCLSFFLRSRLIVASVCLAFVCLAHIAIGFYTAVFIGAYFLFRPSRMLTKEFFASCAIMALAMGGIMLPLLLQPYGGEILPISADDFIRATRSFSNHWHPVTRGFFGNLFMKKTAPVLYALCIAFIASFSLRGQRELLSKIWAGIVSVFMLSVVGVLLSDVLPVPTFVKLCLQRASFLITLVSVLVAISYLWGMLRKGVWYEVVAAALALAAFAGPELSIAFVPWALLLVIQAMKYSAIGPFVLAADNRYRNLIRGGSVGMALLCVYIFCNKITLGLYGGLAPVHYWLGVAVLLVVTGWTRLWMTASYAHNKKCLLQSWAFLALCLIIMVGQVRLSQMHNRLDSYGALAESYIETQKWARAYTSVDARFMVDPSFFYGWRGYSQRASFGTYREWALFGFAYVGGQGAYKEGLRRLRLFGTDPVAIANSLSADGRSLFITDRIVRKQLNETFNGMPLENLLKLARNEMLDYVVLNKERYKANTGERVAVFQNDHFMVFSTE